MDQRADLELKEFNTHRTLVSKVGTGRPFRTLRLGQLSPSFNQLMTSDPHAESAALLPANPVQLQGTGHSDTPAEVLHTLWNTQQALWIDSAGTQ